MILSYNLKPYFLEFRLEGLPKPINAQGSNWAKKSREANLWKRSVTLTIGLRRPIAPLPRAQLVLTRFSSTTPDYDGLISSWKHVIDGLVIHGVLEDDSMAHIGMPTFHWYHAPRNKGFIEVSVKEIV